MELSKLNCKPVKKGTSPLTITEIQKFKKELHPDWKIIEARKIVRDFSFGNYQKNVAFVNKVAALAESEGHHPDILLSYAKVGIELSTHDVDGLSENDFILSAKIDKL